MTGSISYSKFWDVVRIHIHSFGSNENQALGWNAMSESGTPAVPATDRSQSDIQCPARPPFALSISDCRQAHEKDPARRLSSTLSTVNHEAEQYLKNERQGVTIRPTCCERLKQWTTTVVDVRIPSIPISHWLPKYNFRRQLVDDLNAGLACAITLIPQGMAYGAQLGVPVIHGLYSAIFFGLVYAFMGTSRETCPGNSGKCLSHIQYTCPASEAGDGPWPPSMCP